MKLKLLATLFLMLMLSSCKMQKLEGRYVDFKKICSNAYKRGIVEKNPLILLDGKSFGLLSEIDFDNFKFKTVDSKIITIVPKGSEYLKRFWGENAKNGIIEIFSTITLYCGKPPEYIYLLNDKEIKGKELQNLKEKDIKHWIRIDDIKDSKNNNFVVEIIITE